MDRLPRTKCSALGPERSSAQEPPCFRSNPNQAAIKIKGVPQRTKAPRKGRHDRALRGDSTVTELSPAPWLPCSLARAVGAAGVQSWGALGTADQELRYTQTPGLIQHPGSGVQQLFPDDEANPEMSPRTLRGTRHRNRSPVQNPPQRWGTGRVIQTRDANPRPPHPQRPCRGPGGFVPPSPPRLQRLPPQHGQGCGPARVSAHALPLRIRVRVPALPTRPRRPVRRTRGRDPAPAPTHP